LAFRTYYNNELFPPNYAIYHKDRSSRGGGSVLLTIDMSIPSRILPSPEVVVAEVLSSKPFRICVLYNPPNSKLDYQCCLLSFISDLLQDTRPVVLMGDFNAPTLF